MKYILCYGDSNTFGTDPIMGRHPDDVRWTGVLQKLLGAIITVIEGRLRQRKNNRFGKSPMEEMA